MTGNEPTEIHPQIHISDKDYVESREKISESYHTVINLSKHTDAYSDIFYPLNDGSNSQMRFNGAVYNVVRCVEKGQKVLVYCSAGISRSVAVASTALAEIEKTNFVEAFQKIKRKRTQSNPHPELRFHGRKYLGETIHG